MKIIQKSKGNEICGECGGIEFTSENPPIEIKRNDIMHKWCLEQSIKDRPFNFSKKIKLAFTKLDFTKVFII